MTRSSIFLSLAAVLLGAVTLGAQTADDFNMPDELKEFWDRYYPARLADDEEAMDRSVRLKPFEADQALELLLDDLARKDSPKLHAEVRTLAWSLDRIDGSERFIERVRLTLGQDISGRRKRMQAKDRLYATRDKVAKATKDRNEDALDELIRDYVQLSEDFDTIGDPELAIVTLVDAAELERIRGQPWEQSRILQRVGALASDLPFRFQLARDAANVLEDLRNKGIDPDGPKPEELPEGAEGGGLGPGAGLESFADGAEKQEFELESVIPKKGISGVALPNFYPHDHDFLWPFTWIDGEGPVDFDSHKGVFKPRAQQWRLSRDGSSFTIDSSGDGSRAVEFTPSSTPVRVDIPLSDKKGDLLPLMLSVPSDRENVFGTDVNYSPQLASARMRYNIGGYREGKVLGETWKVYDTNISGVYGDEWEYIDDLITMLDDDVPTAFTEFDSVQIGKSKVAIPWSKVLPVGDKFYRANIDDDGTKIDLQELDIATGAINFSIDTKIKPTHVVIQEVGELRGAFFNVVTKRGPATVPVGTYKIAMGRLETGKKTSMDQIRIYGGKSGEFTVKEGETLEMAFGGPFELTAEANQRGSELVVDGRSIRIFGQFGEEYACLFDEAMRPEVSIVDAKGKTLVKAEKMLQADISAWQNHDRGRDNVLYFPLDVAFDMPRDSSYRIHLYQKSHRHLGGPFESAEPPKE